MDSLARYLGVINGKAVDRLPCLPIVMAYAANHIGSNYAAFASDFRVLVEANMRCATAFGFDQLSTISDPYRETHAFGAEIDFPRDAVPRCLRYPLENSKDLSLLKQPDPHSSIRMLDRIRAVESYRVQAFRRYSILGWVEGPAAEAADLRGVANFLMDLMDDEAFCRRLMGLCVEIGAEFAAAQIQAGADTIGIGDAIASQISPRVYGRLVFPYEKRLIELIHHAGGLVRLHICGDITHLLNKIVELEADMIDLDWMVSIAGARHVLGEHAVLVGNLDPVSAIKDGSPAAIHDSVQQIYENIGNPYMVGAGCEIPVGTPPENLRALCQPITYRESAGARGGAI
jgi:MtaA/CmuA family methyltransferase